MVSLLGRQPFAIEVKWSEQLRPNDLKTLRQFSKNIVLHKAIHSGKVDGIDAVPVYDFLYNAN